MVYIYSHFLVGTPKTPATFESLKTVTVNSFTVLVTMSGSENNAQNSFASINTINKSKDCLACANECTTVGG